MDKPNFKTPFTGLISGMTQSGKSTWIAKFLRNANTLMSEAPEEIYYFYVHWQREFDDLAQNHGVKFVRGSPDFTTLSAESSAPRLVIMDDLMTEMSKGDSLTEAFTRSSHHSNLSIWMLVQNLFYKNQRDSRVNSKYLVLMRSPSDKSQVHFLARQMYPESPSLMIKAYNDACSRPYGYLLVDLAMTTDDRLRLRTNIFPDELPEIVYCAKNL